MKTVMVMVECPKGSNQKYDYNPHQKNFKLSKILPTGMVWPFDFGFIPDTKGDDGDPLDVMIISESSCFTGALVDCRIVGAITAEQTERDGKTMRNDRFLAVPEVSHLYAGVADISQLPDGVLKQLEGFFENYNKEAGKNFKPLNRLDAAAAAKLIG